MIKIDLDKLQRGLGVKLNTSQKANITDMLDAFNSYDYKARSISDKSWLGYVAYMFATAWHETGSTMSPLEEWGKGRNKTYGTWYINSKGVAYSFKDDTKTQAYLKSDYPFLYYGRGYVQLTWYANYERASKELGVNLLKDPTIALNKAVATKIMILGMIEGWFTTHKLSRYITDKTQDFKTARKIINGMDKASTIEGYAKAFFSSLS